jgi:hypothetical protein
MPKFKIAVEWSECGTVEVEAKTLKEAAYKVENDLDIPLPESTYIDDSFVVNYQLSEYFAQEKNLPIY